MKKIKFFVVIISIVLCFVCVSAFLGWRHSIEQQKEELNEVQSRITELRKEKEELEKKLGHIDEEETQKEESKEKPRVIVCFYNVSDNIYDEIYPRMAQKRCAAAMVAQAGILPGSIDRITTEHCNELTDDKWGYVIGAGNGIYWNDDPEDNKSDLKKYLKDYAEKYKKETGKKADGIFFADGQYSTEYNSLIRDLGFSTIFYEGVFVKTEGTDKKLTVVHVQEDPSNDDIINTFENGQVTGIKVELSYDSATRSATVYTKEGLNNLLYRISNGVNEGIFQKTNFSNLKYAQKKADTEEEEITDKDEIKSRIKEIESEIKDLYQDDEEE